MEVDCISIDERSDETREDSVGEGRSDDHAGHKIADVVLTVATWVFSAAIIIGALLFSFNASPTKSIFGYRYYTVITPSMEPQYSVGDVVFVQMGNKDKINVGDVITFNPSHDSDAYLTHRVTEKYEDYEGTGVTCFRTKGDANNSEDTFLIDSERVIGVVRFGIPKIGYVIRFVQLRWYFVIPIVVMVFVLVHLMRVYFDDDEDEDEGGEEPAGSPSAT